MGSWCDAMHENSSGQGELSIPHYLSVCNSSHASLSFLQLHHARPMHTFEAHEWWIHPHAHVMLTVIILSNLSWKLDEHVVLQRIGNNLGLAEMNAKLDKVIIDVKELKSG